MNFPSASLPRLHVWFTVILMPVQPDYADRKAALESALAEIKAEQQQLLAHLDTATEDHRREALLKEIGAGKAEIRRLTQSLTHLEQVHQERN